MSESVRALWIDPTAGVVLEIRLSSDPTAMAASLLRRLGEYRCACEYTPGIYLYTSLDQSSSSGFSLYKCDGIWYSCGVLVKESDTKILTLNVPLECAREFVTFTTKGS